MESWAEPYLPNTEKNEDRSIIRPKLMRGQYKHKTTRTTTNELYKLYLLEID